MSVFKQFPFWPDVILGDKQDDFNLIQTMIITSLSDNQI